MLAALPMSAFLRPRPLLATGSTAELFISATPQRLTARRAVSRLIVTHYNFPLYRAALLTSRAIIVLPEAIMTTIRALFHVKRILYM